jgi:hypothetical protein
MAVPKKSPKRSQTIIKRKRILPGNIDDEYEEPKVKPTPRPGRTVEARENQLISMTIDLAARQIKAGTASSQVMTHFLKIGSTKEKLEKEKLVQENALLRAKTESLETAKDTKVLVQNAIDAMKAYSGNGKIKIRVQDEADN